MEGYPNAGKGLQMMFIAAVGSVVCTFLILISVIPFIMNVALLAMLAFGVLSAVGLYFAATDIAGCKTALILTIAGVVIDVVGQLVSLPKALTELLSIVSSVMSIVCVYCICMSLAGVMKSVKRSDLAQRGKTVWIVYLVTNTIGLALSVLVSILAYHFLGVLVALLILIPIVIASVMYLAYIYQCSKVLRTV